MLAVTAFHVVQLLLAGAALAIFGTRWRAISRLARESRDRTLADAQEWRDDLDHAASTGAYALRGIGRAAPLLALSGAVVEMGRALGGGRGLVALEKGLAERLALEHACGALAIGVSTAVLCFTAAPLLLRRVRSARSDLERTGRTLDPPPADV